MKKIIGFLLLFAGLYFCFGFFYQLVESEKKVEDSLEEAKQVVAKKTATSSETMLEKPVFSPEEDEVIGLLTIPKLDKSLPIIEGTEEHMLAKGVGHYSGTAFPDEAEQILLSGHRDTVFRQFGELEPGDRFIVEMPYGKYEYELRTTEIVSADNTSVISPKGEEVLTLSTCYPFNYVGYAPDRYVIYAYPVEK